VLFMMWELKFYTLFIRNSDPSGRSLRGNVGSNTAKGMDVCLL